jgi:DNA-binding CsgD family transcriptional regulator
LDIEERFKNLHTKYDKELLLYEFEEYLKKKFESKELLIPISIFNDSLTPFESISKYLKEKGYGFSEIGKLIKKDRRVVYSTFNRAIKKLPSLFIVQEGCIQIPISFISDENLSVAELIVLYLKEKLSLRFSEIAKLLDKNQRNIWTLYDRAQNKRGGKK